MNQVTPLVFLIAFVEEKSVRNKQEISQIGK